MLSTPTSSGDGVRLRFTDAAGLEWIRNEDGNLEGGWLAPFVD
jgi:hypothetical protein